MSLIRLTVKGVGVAEVCGCCTEKNCSIEIQASASMSEKMGGDSCPGFEELVNTWTQWRDIMHRRKLEIIRQGGGFQRFKEKHWE